MGVASSPCGAQAHEWGRWRKWDERREGVRWYWTEPLVRDCERCGLTQRHRWWRR